MSDGGDDEQHEHVEQHEDKDYDRVRVRHLASKRVGTLRTRSGSGDNAMTANVVWAARVWTDGNHGRRR